MFRIHSKRRAQDASGAVRADDGQAEGRATRGMMTIQVQCYAGYRGEQEPRGFVLGEQRLDVVAIADRWLAPQYRYFKVAASDGNTYVVRHDELSGEWTLGAYRKGQE